MLLWKEYSEMLIDIIVLIDTLLMTDIRDSQWLLSILIEDIIIEAIIDDIDLIQWWYYSINWW